MAEHPEMTATANRSDRSTEHVIREAITPSPYRFTVSVEPPTRHGPNVWCCVLNDQDDGCLLFQEFVTEAEARSHAALVLAALHQATMEET